MWENYGNETLKATVLNENCDRSKAIGKCGILQLFV
jgi:hypothetical protein